MYRGAVRRPPIPDFVPEHPSSSQSSAGEEEDIPMPDYEDDGSGRQRRNSLNFVNKFQNVIFNIRSIEDMYACLPEPDPDYQADDDEATNNDSSSFPPPPPPLTAEELSSTVSAAYDTSVHTNVPVSVDGSDPRTNGGSDPPFIQPKPLHNPCLESRERQALHKELILNYKIGKDVLQKPELNKVLRERKATQKKKEWEEYQNSKGRNSLEVKLEERANRMKEEEKKKMDLISEETQTPELLRWHRKITLKPGKDAPSTS